MVNDVEVCYIVKEKASVPSQEISINGGSSASRIIPFVRAIMGQNRVGVVKICNHDNLQLAVRVFDGR